MASWHDDKGDTYDMTRDPIASVSLWGGMASVDTPTGVLAQRAGDGSLHGVQGAKRQGVDNYWQRQVLAEHPTGKVRKHGIRWVAEAVEKGYHREPACPLTARSTSIMPPEWSQNFAATKAFF